MNIFLCLTFEDRFTTCEVLYITPSREERGGGEIIWLGVSERELKLKTTLQWRLIVNG